MDVEPDAMARAVRQPGQGVIRAEAGGLDDVAGRPVDGFAHGSELGRCEGSRVGRGRVVAVGVGIRVDTHAYQDGVIPPYYDSLVAKLIAHGRDRTEAIQRMKRALDLFVVEGIHTSIPLHKRILNEPDFISGRFNTNFIKRWTP